MVLISPNSTRQAARQPEIALIGEDLYSVMSSTETLGFVYKTGNVYVALSGRDFARAVEVGQTLSKDRAIDIVRTC